MAIRLDTIFISIFLPIYRHYWRDSPLRPKCDAICKKNFICDARSGRSHDRKNLCEALENSDYEQESNGMFSG